jgi:hypothetical protein
MIATGVVSEKSRGINEPLAKPLIDLLPLLENFNDRKPANYTLSRARFNGNYWIQSTGPVNLMVVLPWCQSSLGCSTSTTAFTNNQKDYLL